MTRQNVAFVAAVRLWLGHVVADEGAEDKRGFNRMDVELSGWRASVGIVVALHQDDFAGAMLLPPTFKGRQGVVALAVAGVEEVAQDNQVGGLALGQQARQAVEVMVKDCGWDGDSQMAKGIGLAKVGIGDKKRLPCGPVDCAFGIEAEGYWLVAMDEGEVD